MENPEKVPWWHLTPVWWGIFIVYVLLIAQAGLDRNFWYLWMVGLVVIQFPNYLDQFRESRLAGKIVWKQTYILAWSTFLLACIVIPLGFWLRMRG